MLQSQLATIAKAILSGVVAISITTCAHNTSAQESSSLNFEEQKQLHKKLVLEIYESTKTAKSAKDYTAILGLCEKALADNLSTKNRDYVTSLTGWARSRRGEERFELAMNLEEVGNRQSAKVKKQAMEDFDESLLADPKRYRSWMARGISHSHAGDFRKAALDFTEVVKLKTDHANGWFNRAESLYHMGQFERAIEDYDVVLRMNSDDAEALTGRAHSNLALKNEADAMKDYDRVIELQPGHSVAYLNRGDAHSDQCEWQKSLADYEESNSLKSEPIVLQRLSWLKATCTDETIYDPKAAVALIKQAIEKGGKSTTFLDTLAAAQAANGNFANAKSTQQNAIQLAGAEEEIGEELKTRLTLYEKSEAYKQPTDKK